MDDPQNPYRSPQEAGTPVARDLDARRRKSRFWIVSTHVLTTGFVMPSLAAAVALGALSKWHLQGNRAFLVMLACQAAGYVGGVYYSLSYLRKVTAVADPKGCTKAAIAAFLILAGVGLILNISTSEVLNPLRISSWVVFYAGISFAFAKITAKGFAEMVPHLPDPV